MSPSSTTPGDALELLSDDQEQILELFDRYDALASAGESAGTRRALAEEICSLLAVHLEAKQEVLYPAARDALDDETPLDEAIECQASVDATIRDVQAGDPTQPAYDAGLRTLQELFVEAIDQERTRLFPRLRESSLDLEELGAELGAREELMLEADERSTPDEPPGLR